MRWSVSVPHEPFRSSTNGPAAFTITRAEVETGEEFSTSLREQRAARRWKVALRLLWLAFLGTLVFVPGDLVKCALSAMVVHTIARGLPDWKLGGRAAL